MPLVNTSRLHNSHKRKYTCTYQRDDMKDGQTCGADVNKRQWEQDGMCSECAIAHWEWVLTMTVGN